ncbi:MAG: sugar phosphate isomerase/epimerase, partial [Christensenella sp.]|uniref:sugar phosphate isomerase/epimerase family protein n=1 Tax=Christensenella sp. TaxID=1935934 RepID=UPI002B1EBB4D
CVLHPHGPVPDEPGFVRQDSYKRVLERTLELDNIAKKENVELLVENMPFTDQLMDQEVFLKTFEPENQLKFLIDTGHAILNKWNMTEILKTLKSRIRAYHIHDNFGDFDAHLKVGEGPTDWTKFFKDYWLYTPDARLVLEYAKGPIDSITENVETVKEYYERAR